MATREDHSAELFRNDMDKGSPSGSRELLEGYDYSSVNSEEWQSDHQDESLDQPPGSGGQEDPGRDVPLEEAKNDGLLFELSESEHGRELHPQEVRAAVHGARVNFHISHAFPYFSPIASPLLVPIA